MVFSGGSTLRTTRSTKGAHDINSIGMPELPDVTLYVEALRRARAGQPLERLRIGNPFVVRTVAPARPSSPGEPWSACAGSGKRIVLALERRASSSSCT